MTPFVQPRYDEGGFASLPRRILAWLTTGAYDRVVLFVLDGFGWRFFEQFHDFAGLGILTRRSRVEKLTSQFPSTTSVHVTTLHTGQMVGEHALLEWNMYEPILDAVIAPLLFSFAGTMERDRLAGKAEPAAIYPTARWYLALQEQGIQTTVIQHGEYNRSTYSRMLLQGCRLLGYKTLAEGFTHLEQALQQAQSRAFFHFYYDRIDALSHEYGPTALQTEAEIQAFWLLFDFFLRRLSLPARRTLFLLTADHGAVEVNPATTIYLNTDARFAGLERFLRRNGHGEVIAPVGACRDFFLFIQPGAVEEAQSFLAQRLEGRAEVWRVEEMIASGWFGPQVSPRFRARCGDLIILPYAGEAVWWYEKDRFEQKYYGHHGGLTPQEMEVPLLLWEM